MNIKIKTTKVRPIRRDGRGYNGTPSSGSSFSGYSMASVPSWKSITGKPFELLNTDFSVATETKELQLSGSIGANTLYHSGNANRPDISWDMNNAHVEGKMTIRGSTDNERIQLWADSPWIGFYDESDNQRKGYIQSLNGNMLVDVAGSNDGIHFRIGNTLQSFVSNAGLNLPDGNVLQAYEKAGTSWGNYDNRYTATIGALDVKLKNDNRAAWVWSSQNHAGIFANGFQVLDNDTNYSRLYLSPRLRIRAANGLMTLEKDENEILGIGDTVSAYRPVEVFSDDGVKIIGSAPFLTFWDKNNNYRLGYLRGYPDGNLHISAKQYIQLRVNDNIQIGEIRDWGTLLFDGKIHRIFDKFGMTDWDQYSASHYQSMGGLDVKLFDNTNATYVWSVRDAGDNYKAGFQISNNSNNSIFDLNQRLRLKGWNDKFIFELDKAPMMALGYNAEFFGSLKVAGGIYATSYETKRTKTTNGDLLVTDSVVVTGSTWTASDGTTVWRIQPDYEVNNRIPFDVGDAVVCKIQDKVGNIRFWKGIISYVSPSGTTADIYHGHQDPTSNTVPKDGDTVVRVSGTTISLTTSDTGNPEMEFKDGDRTALLLNDKGGQKIDTDGSLKDIGGIGFGDNKGVSVSEAGIRVSEDRNMTVTLPNLRVNAKSLNAGIAAQSINFPENDPRRIDYQISAGIAAVAQSTYKHETYYPMVDAKTDFALVGVGNNFLDTISLRVATVSSQDYVSDQFFLERNPVSMYRLPRGGISVTFPSASAFRTGHIIMVTGFRGDVSWVHLNSNDQVGGWKGGIFKFYDAHSTLQLMAVSNSAWAIISMTSVEFTRGNVTAPYDSNMD